MRRDRCRAGIRWLIRRQSSAPDAARLLLVSLLLGWMLQGCSHAPSPATPTVAVEAVAAKIAPISQVITAGGILFPIRQASLSPKITAPVDRFYVQRGDKVHRGELLAVLDNRDLAAAVVTAQGNYDQAKAKYVSSTASTLPEEIQAANLGVKNAQTALAAQQKLYASESKLYQQGAIARKQLDATEVTLTAAQSSYQQAEKRLDNLTKSGESAQRQAAKGQLEAARGQYLSATAQLAFSQIRSPIDGVVAERTVFPGDIAPAGQPLIVVMNTSKMVARMHIRPEQAAELKLGDPAELSESGSTQKSSGKVTVISPALDPGSTTVEVWVQTEDQKSSLQPGDTVTVSITAHTIADALVIPSSAILTGADGSESVMLVNTEGRAQSQAVTTGIQQGAMTQIVQGLHPGQEVIVSGSYGLPDGTKVKVSPSGSAGGFGS